MVKTFRCAKCGKKLFDVVGGQPTTALQIKCARCGGVSIFDYLPKRDPGRDRTGASSGASKEGL